MTAQASTTASPSVEQPSDAVLLKISGLHTYFHTENGVSKAVNGVDYDVKRGETLAVVGESGCGKSVTALSILQLIDKAAGGIVDGEIWFDGKNLLTLSEREVRRIRGSDIAMIFQEPMTSLNPVYTIGEQIGEAIRQHRQLSRAEEVRRVIELLELVGIPAPETRIKDYPHQLSGGMRQRVMIAMALSCNPKLLIADEPTTALDVTIQAQVMELIDGIKQKFGTSVILITHDLGVVAEYADRVVVMYAGKVVEEGDVHSIFEHPLHPYTQGLLQSMPRLDVDYEDGETLSEIAGMVPLTSHLPSGCAFHPRCPHAMEICRQRLPGLDEHEPGHRAQCWLYQPETAAGPKIAGRED